MHVYAIILFEPHVCVNVYYVAFIKSMTLISNLDEDKALIKKVIKTCTHEHYQKLDII